MGLYKVLRNYDRRVWCFLIGTLAGVFISKFVLLSNYVDIDEMQIHYVSQNEILDLEKIRISKINDNDEKQLFLGRSERAANLIENVAMNYEGKERRVVFSENKVYGRNVKSISKEVYEEVIEKLKEQGLDE